MANQFHQANRRRWDAGSESWARRADNFEFHWTVADYVSAIVCSGCRIVHIEEFGDTSEKWEGAPMNGLPGTLLLVGYREESRAFASPQSAGSEVLAQRVKVGGPEKVEDID